MSLVPGGSKLRFGCSLRSATDQQKGLVIDVGFHFGYLLGHAELDTNFLCLVIVVMFSFSPPFLRVVILIGLHALMAIRVLSAAAAYYTGMCASRNEEAKHIGWSSVESGHSRSRRNTPTKRAPTVFLGEAFHCGKLTRSACRGYRTKHKDVCSKQTPKAAD